MKENICYKIPSFGFFFSVLLNNIHSIVSKNQKCITASSFNSRHTTNLKNTENTQKFFEKLHQSKEFLHSYLNYYLLRYLPFAHFQTIWIFLFAYMTFFCVLTQSVQGNFVWTLYSPKMNAKEEIIASNFIFHSRIRCTFYYIIIVMAMGYLYKRERKLTGK